MDFATPLMHNCFLEMKIRCAIKWQNVILNLVQAWLVFNRNRTIPIKKMEWRDPIGSTMKDCETLQFFIWKESHIVLLRLWGIVQSLSLHATYFLE